MNFSRFPNPGTSFLVSINICPTKLPNSIHYQQTNTVYYFSNSFNDTEKRYLLQIMNTARYIWNERMIIGNWE